jgi:heat shock protein HspQ
MQQLSGVRPMGRVGLAKFSVGQVVRHRVYPFRGIIFDIDPIFNNTEEWWKSIPAYVSEQNLLPDASGTPLRHPQVGELFALEEDGNYRPLFLQQPH